MIANDEFLCAIVESDRVGAAKVAHAALSELGPVGFYTEVLQESLYEVGRLWEAGELTVAAEHAATATAQFVLSSVFFDLPPAPAHRGIAVVAGSPGEMHQVGAHIVSDVLQSDGWDVHFLGADVPVDALVAAVVEHEAALVGLSVTIPSHLPTLSICIARLREEVGADLRILVGGQGYRGDVVDLGGDAFARDALEAREFARAIS